MHESSSAIPDRAVIELDWGGLLYTCDVLPADTLNREYRDWGSFILWISTSMTLSIKFINLIEGIFMKYGEYLTFSQIEGYLHSLETCHWHGYGFNENLPLRLKLQDRGLLARKFSDRAQIPNLLDQEVRSFEVMLGICFTLYAKPHSKAGSSSKFFILPWIER